MAGRFILLFAAFVLRSARGASELARERAQVRKERGERSEWRVSVPPALSDGQTGRKTGLSGASG